MAYVTYNPDGSVKSVSGDTSTNLGQTALASLSPASAPTSADKITQVKSPTIPQQSPYFGNVNGAVASTQGAKTGLDVLIQENKDREAQRVAAQERSDKANKTMLSKLMGSTVSPTQAREDAQAETGIVPAEYFADQKARITEIDSLTKDYNAVVALKDEQIAQTKDKLGTNNFINNQVAQIERNAAPKLNLLSANINSKAATLQALQGNFHEAQTFVNQAVQDATADTKYKMDAYQLFYRANQDSLDRMDSIYQDSFKTSMDLATRVYEEDLANKKATGDAIIKYNSLGAGINITDTPDVVAQKIAAVGGDLEYYRKQQAIQKQYSASGGGGTATSGFKDSDIEASVRQEAVDRLKEVKLGNMTLDEVYKEMRILFSRGEVTDEALKDLLGITPSPEMTTGNSSFRPLATPKAIYSGVSQSTPAYFATQEQLQNNIFNLLFK